MRSKQNKPIDASIDLILTLGFDFLWNHLSFYHIFGLGAKFLSDYSGMVSLSLEMSTLVGGMCSICYYMALALAFMRSYSILNLQFAICDLDGIRISVLWILCPTLSQQLSYPVTPVNHGKCP